MKKIGIGIVATIAFTACDSTDTIPVETKEMIKVEVQLPEYYTIGNWEQEHSRVKLPKDLQPNDFWTNDEKWLKNLPENSTLWVIYEKKQDNNNYSPAELKGYIVKANAGYNSLYACTTTTTSAVTTINPEEWGAPLYLEEGTYRFRMITPALPIKKGVDGLYMEVDNGIYLYATDDRYERTEAQDIDVTYTGDTQERVQYVKLPPMIAQMARLKFSLKKGENVYSLEMLDAGIEISGIQSKDSSADTYNWRIDQELPMERGNKRSIVRIKGNRFTTNEEGTLSSDIGILPTYAESNSVVILINIAVNGVPTQYETVLNGMTFWHACSYNLNMEVSLKDNIVVMTWQNQSWVTDQTW